MTTASLTAAATASRACWRCAHPRGGRRCGVSRSRRRADRRGSHRRRYRRCKCRRCRCRRRRCRDCGGGRRRRRCRCRRWDRCRRWRGVHCRRCGRGRCWRGRNQATRCGHTDARPHRAWRHGAFLHNLDLYGFGSAMAEGLADAACIHRLAKLEASAGPKAQPAFTRVLLVLVTHSPLRTRSSVTH